jgi:hypothetical protein
MQILGPFLLRLVGVARPRQPKQFALPRDTERRVIGFDQRAFGLTRGLQLFFQPVELDFELADLLVELGLQRFVLAVVAVAVGCKEPWKLALEMLFPLANLRRMDAVATGEFVDRVVTFEHLEGYPGFACCTVTSTLCRHQWAPSGLAMDTAFYLNDLSSAPSRLKRWIVDQLHWQRWKAGCGPRPSI